MGGAAGAGEVGEADLCFATGVEAADLLGGVFAVLPAVAAADAFLRVTDADDLAGECGGFAHFIDIDIATGAVAVLEVRADVVVPAFEHAAFLGGVLGGIKADDALAAADGGAADLELHAHGLGEEDGFFGGGFGVHACAAAGCAAQERIDAQPAHGIGLAIVPFDQNAGSPFIETLVFGEALHASMLRGNRENQGSCGAGR